LLLGTGLGALDWVAHFDNPCNTSFDAMFLHIIGFLAAFGWTSIFAARDVGRITAGVRASLAAAAISVPVASAWFLLLAGYALTANYPLAKCDVLTSGFEQIKDDSETVLMVRPILTLVGAVVIGFVGGTVGRIVRRS
jgi:hypothetical protein